MYSQNNEEEVILNYFGDFKGTLVDIGANDGKTLSNSLALIERGWKALLVEPAPQAYMKLADLHKENMNVACFNFAIGTAEGEEEFYDSGTHLNKGDTSLLSTLKNSEVEKWKPNGTEFTPIYVECRTFKTLEKFIDRLDFLTIDAEGMDFEILRQIDLSRTQCVCVEYNNDAFTLDLILSYCSVFGLHKILLKNFENVIIAR